jgi:hypothetical protein
MLLLSVLAAACARTAPDAVEEAPAGVASVLAPTDSGLAAFLHGGLLDIGGTRSAIAERLGEPDSMTVRAVANRHDPAVTDSVFELYYHGLTAEVYRAGYDGKEMLTGLEIRDERYLTTSSAVRPGTPAAALRVALGEPTDSTDGHIQYVCDECLVSGHETVRFVMNAGVVHAIHVQYWID